MFLFIDFNDGVVVERFRIFELQIYVEVDIGGGNQGDIVVDDFIFDSFECFVGLWFFFFYLKYREIKFYLVQLQYYI